MSSFQTDKSSKVVATHAVCAPTGQVIAKRYAAKELREGDVGLTLRLDLNESQLTPAQRESLLIVLDEMHAAARTTLGAENTGDFPRGAIVRLFDMNGAEKMTGVLERESEGFINLRCFTRDGRLIRKSLPRTMFIIEEVDCDLGTGVPALAELTVRNVFFESPRARDEMDCGEIAGYLETQERIDRVAKERWANTAYPDAKRLDSDLARLASPEIVLNYLATMFITGRDEERPLVEPFLIAAMIRFRGTKELIALASNKSACAIARLYAAHNCGERTAEMLELLEKEGVHEVQVDQATLRERALEKLGLR